MTHMQIIHAWICCVNDTFPRTYKSTSYWISAYLNPADQYMYPHVSGWWGWE